MNASAGPNGTSNIEPNGLRFDDTGLLDALEAVSLTDLDDLGFGLIVMDRDAIVMGYNAFEAKLSGLPPGQVLGRNFFVDIGPCTNNYLIAERYGDDDGGDLDEQLDYVFTYRMAPTPVRLRLLARPGSARQYLAVQPR